MNQEQDLVTKEIIVYAGTYTEGPSEGIYICRLDMTSGQLSQVGIASQVDNPSYLAVDPERLRLFSVNELVEFGGRPGGGVSAFAIQPSSGELSLINQQFTHGGAPCYLTLDPHGRHLFVVNYMGGNIALIPVGDDGALEEPTAIITHLGSSLHPDRQQGPHPHSIAMDPAGDHAFVPDLGLDKVMQYRFDRERGRLLSNEQPWVNAAPGCGPRHMVFHPNNQFAYVINELNSTITAYAHDPAHGLLEAKQTLSTLPAGYSGRNTAADLHLSPDGRYLYGSNRGHDSIATYAVDQSTGRLAKPDFTPTQGKNPRGFALDPSGTFLLAANQDSHTIVTYWIDRERGTLVPTGHTIDVPSPVCLKLMALESS